MKYIKNLNHKIYIISLLFVFLMYAVVSYIGLDPDFGWHLRTGELILKGNFPTTEPFSYTMPSYPLIEHEWLSDVIFATIHNSFGYWLLAVIFSALITMTIFICTFNHKNGYYSAFFVVLAAGVLFRFSGVRPQVITWFLLSVMFFILNSKDLWKKYRFFMPFIFLLWANLHGGFAAGFLLFGFFIVMKGLLKLKIDKSDIFVVTLSFIATFVNPVRERLWVEAFRQLSDSNLYRWTIVEWMPAALKFDFSYVFFLALSVVLIWNSKKIFSLQMLLIFFVMAFQGFVTLRHVPLWFVIALPLTLDSYKNFLSRIKTIEFAEERLKIVLKPIVVMVLIAMIFHFSLNIYSSMSMSAEKFYPVEAIEYLKKHPFEGELFADYGWGGYLIWKYPEKKVFIDGRMPSMKRENGPDEELDWAFRVYLDVISGKAEYQPYFEKFGVQRVLLRKRPSKKNITDMFASFVYKAIGKDEKNFHFETELKEDGWEVVFEDGQSILLAKVK